MKKLSKDNYTPYLHIVNSLLSRESESTDTLLLSMESFGSWLLAQLEKKKWKQADLARASNLDSAVISNLVNGRRGPGEDTSIAIAKALGYPPELVFRAAGLLPQKADLDEDTEELLYLYDRLPIEAKNQVVNFTRFLVERKDNDTNGQAKK